MQSFRAFRIHDHDGVIRAGVEQSADELTSRFEPIIREALPDNPFVEQRLEKVGPKIGKELIVDFMSAIFWAIVLILFYVMWRFEFKFALGAILALLHDVFITLGLFSILDIEISAPIIAAVLTIVGYSLNDTIVLFDRIRENLAGKNKTITKELINSSINQNLNRTIITSLTTFGVVAALFFVGGTAIHGFAFVMMVGVVVGTYSSIFIASPILLDWIIVKKVFRIVIIIIFFPIWIAYRLLHKTPDASTNLSTPSTPKIPTAPKAPASPKGQKKPKGPKVKRAKSSRA